MNFLLSDKNQPRLIQVNTEIWSEVASEIKYAGGVAEAAQVDAFDERSVNEHLDEVVAKAGSINISFNVIEIETLTAQVSRKPFDNVRGFGVAYAAIKGLFR
jgi:hypothetical protein